MKIRLLMSACKQTKLFAAPNGPNLPGCSVPVEISQPQGLSNDEQQSSLRSIQEKSIKCKKERKMSNWKVK